jgi:hypothetical protein
MTRIRRLVAVTIVAFSLAAAASAVRAQGPAGLDSATMTAIAPIVERARASGLPLELLYTRARQGQVQRLPVVRIEVAVRNYAERLATAHEALAPNATTPELKAGVDALQTGVPRETLSEMRRVVKDGSLAVPLGILTTLVARGVSVEKASVQIVDLLQRGASPAHFIALDDRVRADVLAGKRPDEALDLRLKGIFPNLPQPVNADAVGLQNANTPRRPR